MLALWLTKLGVSVRIIDKTAEPGTTSRAVGVHARTLEFYRQVGLADAMVEGGVKVPGVNFWARGAKAARLPFRHIGEGLSPFPFLLDFPQDAHERLLIERLDALGVRVERRTELVRFDQHHEGVRATLKRPDGSEETCEAAYLAGCDGAHSTVRDGLCDRVSRRDLRGPLLRRRRGGERPVDRRRAARRSRRRATSCASSP